MRKWSVFAALCFVGVLAASADAASVPKHRSYTCLIGGTFGCLDKEPIVAANPDNNLVTGDMADVQVGGLRYTYEFDKSGTAAESSPAVIRPDDYDTNGPGVWNLSGVYAASVKVGGVDVQVQDAELTALAGLTFADASIIQLTGASAAAVLTSGGANYILGSNSDNTALEFKSSLNISGLSVGGIVLGDTTPDETGEITVDTTTDQFQWYGASTLRAVSPTLTSSLVVPAVADTDDMLFTKLPYGVTVTALDCIVSAATSATINIQECDSAGANCSDMATSDLTCDTDGANTTTFANAAADSGDWLKLGVVSISGTPGTLTVTVTYTVTPD